MIFGRRRAFAEQSNGMKGCRISWPPGQAADRGGRRSLDAWKAERGSRRLQGWRQAIADRPAVRLVPVRGAESAGEPMHRGERWTTVASRRSAKPMGLVSHNWPMTLYGERNQHRSGGTGSCWCSVRELILPAAVLPTKPIRPVAPARCLLRALSG
jgi:hypothetical protein